MFINIELTHDFGKKNEIHDVGIEKSSKKGNHGMK